ncbi:MAG: radical SAM protein [Candidatus Omnitrophica bacterium]|nr:radical SAM protein [Candidatus Omnitrophota bacterium]
MNKITNILRKIVSRKYRRMIRKYLGLDLVNKFVLRKKNLKLANPTELAVELTTACNLKCAFCPHDKMPPSFKQKDVDRSLLDLIIENVEGFSNKRIHMNISGFGEPTLSRHLFYIIEKIKKNFPLVHTAMNTNGVLLNETTRKGLLSSGIDSITISLNADTPGNYAKIMGADYFDKVMENIKLFFESVQNNRTNIEIAIDLMDINNQEIKTDVRNISRQLSRYPHLYHIFLRPVLNWGGVISGESFNAEREKKNVFADRYPCISLWRTIGVDNDGYIYPCCLGMQLREDSGLVLGNIKEVSILDCFNSDKLKAMRRYHLENNYSKIPECEKCDFWSFSPNIFVKDSSSGHWK